MSSPVPGHTLIEGPKRLSESALWRLVPAYYEGMSIEAFRTAIVPHYITTNIFIARTYAQLALAYLRDLREAGVLEPGRPVYIVELGSATGRFAYHFLRTFLPRLRQSHLRDTQVKYVLTDCVPGNLEFWRNHPKFQPYFDEGLLDYALFNACGDTALKLQRSGETISADRTGGNMIVFANYIFDSLPQDFFWSSEGTLYESLVNVYSPEPEPDFSRPDMLSHMRLHFNRQPIEDTNYYPDPGFNHLLGVCGEKLEGSTFGVPLGAMRLMDLLHAMTNGRLLVITADKGFHRGEHLADPDEPKIAIHGSTFSILVNYWVLKAYAALRGGDMLAADHGHAHIDMVGFLFGDAAGYAETRLAFREALEFGPDEYFTIKRYFDDHSRLTSLELLMSLLRLSGYDDRLYLTAGHVLLPMLEDAGSEMRVDLAAALEEAWQSQFPIGEPIDPEYLSGVLLAKMQIYPKALEFFRRSEAAYGEKALVAYSRGICQYRLGDRDAARASLVRAIEMDPELEPARDLLKKVENGE